MNSLSKAGARLVIALDGGTNGNGGLFVVEGNGGSTDQRTLRVAGTIALESGRKMSVNIFTRDESWEAKSSSRFSCHLLKMFDGCTEDQAAEALAHVFAFADDQINNTSNSTTRDVLIPPVEDVVDHSARAEKFLDAGMRSYTSVSVYLLINLIIHRDRVYV